MRVIDEDALICDLAQYYNVHNYREYDIQHIAILACGLPIESRIIKKISGQNFGIDTILLAGIVDRLSELIWLQTRRRASNRPKSILNELIETKHKKQELVAYDSIEDFEAARKKILGN